MAKAILIMNMPECCAYCQLADDDPGGLYCVFADNYYDGSDSSEDRASFCPLRELPEKKETNYYMNNKEKGIVEGWNACLDEIMK